ncbi:MAG TPA: hypothetical protein VFG42_12430 [Baekduia sp.]|uniref:hypothetical protein n=1 Tax=Baekduia sp. TaxID=2600305 RepID=UPI002D787D4C|nr:hypothetical protein [Baekduia sp.]HET6507587.1 hypothetical protein [Baekduia sp.]
MARTLKTLDETDLEAALMRKSVDTLEAGRHTCADCGRTPLVGERVYRFGSASSVCALCTPLRRAEPDAVELVRHSECGITVRRITPRAA